jgi:site-specific DNA recombinase
MTVRAGLYTRVSSEMQVSNYSLDAQRRALRDACTQRGYTIALEATDEGLSARSERIELRPGLTALLDAVKAHQVDVVAVHSLDRLSRNVMVTLTVFKLLAANDVAFISLSENIDYSSPEGKLQLVILGGFSAYFSDVLSKHTSKGKAERAAQGRHNNAPPFGYTRNETGMVILDVATEAAAREMWRLAVAGNTDRQIADALAPLGHVMSRDTVRYLLTNRFFLGEVRHRQTWHKGQHPAMIDAATWDTVQALRVAHRRTASGPRAWGSTQRAEYSLGGLLTCARCFRHLQGSDGGHNYICWGRRGYQCTQPMVTDAALAVQFGDLLSRLVIPEDVLRAAVETRETARPRVNTEAVERTLDRLRRQYAWGHLDESAYLRQYEECEAVLKQADAEIAVDDAEEIMARLRDLRGLWDNATTGERHTIASSVVSDVLIDDRRIVGVKPQEAWCSGLTCSPVKAEIAGSNPVSSADTSARGVVA